MEFSTAVLPARLGLKEAETWLRLLVSPLQLAVGVGLMLNPRSRMLNVSALVIFVLFSIYQIIHWLIDGSPCDCLVVAKVAPVWMWSLDLMSMLALAMHLYLLRRIGPEQDLSQPASCGSDQSNTLSCDRPISAHCDSPASARSVCEDGNRSRLTRGPPQFWRLERICFAKLSFAKIALALRLNEEPDSIRERLREDVTPSSSLTLRAETSPPSAHWIKQSPTWDSLKLSLTSVAVILAIFGFSVYGPRWLPSMQRVEIVRGTDLLASIPADGVQQLRFIAIRNHSSRPVALHGGTAHCACTVLAGLPRTIPPWETASVPVYVRATLAAESSRIRIEFFTDFPRQSALTGELYFRSVPVPKETSS